MVITLQLVECLKNLNITASTTNAIPKTTFASNEVDELIKQMEQLSLNYADLTTALLAQPQGEEILIMKETSLMNVILMKEILPATGIFLIVKGGHNK